MRNPYLIPSLLVVVTLFVGLCWVLGDLRDSLALNQMQATAIETLQSEISSNHREISTLENDIRSLTAERNEAAAIARKVLGITDAN